MQRFDRNIRLFGAEGQRRIHETHAAIIGCGGLGEHVVPQLACLGVGTLTLVDDEELSESNRNRYVLARQSDPVPGTHKVDIAARAIMLIDPAITVHLVRTALRSREVFDALRHADTLFGCLDNDGARLLLNEFALAYGKRYFDLASDVDPEDGLRYGGRLTLVDGSPGCLVCRGLINPADAQKELEGSLSRKDRAAIYGVDEALLEEAGPSVVSVNGVVASLAVTEFMVAVTGLRAPRQHVNYRGDMGVVTAAKGEAAHDCYYCNLRGAGAKAGVERYIP